MKVYIFAGIATSRKRYCPIMEATESTAEDKAKVVACRANDFIDETVAMARANKNGGSVLFAHLPAQFRNIIMEAYLA